jgi:MarR family transcriptional regulator, organic hydroperoxide resistance regulator
MTRNRPINEHIAYLLAQANRQIHQKLDEEFRDEGVPVEQWRILKLLA